MTALTLNLSGRSCPTHVPSTLALRTVLSECKPRGLSVSVRLNRSLAVSSSTPSYVALGLCFMRTGAVADFDSVSHQTVPAQTIFDMTKLLPGTQVRVNGDVTWTGEAIKGWLGPLFTIDGRSFAGLFRVILSFSPDRHSPSNRYKHHIRRASSRLRSLLPSCLFLILTFTHP